MAMRSSGSRYFAPASGRAAFRRILSTRSRAPLRPHIVGDRSISGPRYRQVALREVVERHPIGYRHPLDGVRDVAAVEINRSSRLQRIEEPLTDVVQPGGAVEHRR